MREKLKQSAFNVTVKIIKSAMICFYRDLAIGCSCIHVASSISATCFPRQSEKCIMDKCTVTLSPQQWDIQLIACTYCNKPLAAILKLVDLHLMSLRYCGGCSIRNCSPLILKKTDSLEGVASMQMKYYMMLMLQQLHSWDINWEVDEESQWDG